MSNAFAETRADLVTALNRTDEPLGTVYDHVPGRLVPPCVVIVPGSPYVEKSDGDTFASHTLRFEVWVVAANGTNDTETSDLDSRIDSAVRALTSDGFGIDRVDEPFTYQLQGANFLATSIHATATVAFNS